MVHGYGIHIHVPCQLSKNNVKIYSTGGTYKYISELGYDVTEVENVTDYPSIFGGRVKTLHPKIFGGILFRRDNKNDIEEKKKFDIPSIDLVIVDLYPFEETVKNSKSESEIIEKIDIGGIALIRAAAKNFKNVLIITNKNNYPDLINELKKYNSRTNLNFRQHMSAKAFGLTAYYDSMIAEWFNTKLNIKFPERKTIYGKKMNNLRFYSHLFFFQPR